MKADVKEIRKLIVENTTVDPDTLSVIGFDKAAKAIAEYVEKLPYVLPDSIQEALNSGDGTYKP